MAAFGTAALPVVPPVLPEAEVVADSTEVHFPLSSCELDLALDGNGERLNSILRQIKQISGRDSTYVLTVLRVIGSSSPEGSEAINRRLSEQRAHALFEYFAQHISFPDSISDFEYLGRNWTGLYRLVVADPDVPAQTEVLALLGRTAVATPISVAESNALLRRLKALKGGIPYAYMYRHLFPTLRYSNLYVEYEKRIHREIENLVLKTMEADKAVLRADTLDSASTLVENLTDSENPDLGNRLGLWPEEDTHQAMQPSQTPTDVKPASPKERNFYMDLRTNMLFDIAAVPNIGAEFYLGRNISISADWMYSWWSYDRRHRYWRIYGGDLGLRWWVGRKAHEKPLTGHHLGIYGGVLMFDFELGATGYMGGKPGGTLWDRCLVNSGIEYGYSLPIAPRLNIDFSIGFGYLGGNYIKYFPFDNEYYREKEYRMRFFGPTKAEISLVWLLGNGNVNRKANRDNRKGGEE